MKINILFPFRDNSWGGGNQFLKALRREFVASGIYEEDPVLADVIVLNSHHCLMAAARLKSRYPEKIFIHRIDGPISLVRGFDLETDKLIQAAAKYIADALVFQSEYSMTENTRLGLNPPSLCRVIYNAPDKNIFVRKKSGLARGGKIRLITTSWSQNPRKGFEVYKYLDENLDFSKYSYKFIGNSPVRFRNIKFVEAVGSDRLSAYLGDSDIYITASQKDPCSNALIEALACGLPAIALADGGHPELVGEAGELFSNMEEVPVLLDKVVADYAAYQGKIKSYDISETALLYADFCAAVVSAKFKTGMSRKKGGFVFFVMIRLYYTALAEIKRRLTLLFRLSRRPDYIRRTD